MTHLTVHPRLDGATAARALAREPTAACALPLAVLTDHERGAPTGPAQQEAQGAQGALVDPELLLPDVWEPLREPAPLLGMARLAQPSIGPHQALRVHPPNAGPRRGATQVPHQAWRRCAVEAT